MSNWSERRRKTHHRRHLDEKRQKQMAQAVVSCVMVMGSLLALGMGLSLSAGAEESIPVVRNTNGAGDVASLSYADFAGSTVLAAHNDSQCQALYSWPVRKPLVIKRFDRPPTPWAPGHRGVDLEAGKGHEILAPRDGIVSFVGMVAGKHVLSIRHDNGVTSTFEPAQTDLVIGTEVIRDQVVGRVEGESDHCAEQCLHWGLKRGANDYLDPESQTANRRIALKPF